MKNLISNVLLVAFILFASKAFAKDSCSIEAFADKDGNAIINVTAEGATRGQLIGFSIEDSVSLDLNKYVKLMAEEIPSYRGKIKAQAEINGRYETCETDSPFTIIPTLHFKTPYHSTPTLTSLFVVSRLIYGQGSSQLKLAERHCTNLVRLAFPGYSTEVAYVGDFYGSSPRLSLYPIMEWLKSEPRVVNALTRFIPAEPNSYNRFAVFSLSGDAWSAPEGYHPTILETFGIVGYFPRLNEELHYDYLFDVRTPANLEAKVICTSVAPTQGQ